jgi:nucleoside-diphosphate-sugar epimerase
MVQEKGNEYLTMHVSKRYSMNHTKTVLITGGSGFFGLHLCRCMLDGGWNVKILDLVAPNDPSIDTKVQYIKGDICKPGDITAACKGASAVIHNAAVVPISRSGAGFLTINVDGTRNVLDACVAAAVPKVIFISSSSVYGIPYHVPVTEATPLNAFGDYGKSKAVAEAVCASYKDRLDISIIRPRTILGTGRLGIIQILFEWVKENRRFYVIGKGANRYQLVSAPDLANACRLVLEKPCKGEDFNIGAQEFTTLRGDLDGFFKAVGSKTRLLSIPPKLARLTLRILDVLRISPFVDYHYKILNQDIWFDTSKAQKMLGWKSKDSNISMLVDAYHWYIKHEHELDTRAGTTHRRKVKLGVIKFVKWLS